MQYLAVGKLFGIPVALFVWADLAAAQQLAPRALPTPRPASKTFHFVIDAPEDRYLYLRIAPHLASVNGFVQASFYDSVMAVPAYPRQVAITGEGSLLTLTGRQHLGIMARGLTALRISVGRLLPAQITHLVTQTGGDIRDPYFSNPNFTADNIADFSRRMMALKPLHPGKANYSSLDLSAHLPSDRLALLESVDAQLGPAGEVLRADHVDDEPAHPGQLSGIDERPGTVLCSVPSGKCPAAGCGDGCRSAPRRPDNAGPV